MDSPLADLGLPESETSQHLELFFASFELGDAQEHRSGLPAASDDKWFGGPLEVLEKLSRGLRSVVLESVSLESVSICSGMPCHG